MRAATVVDAHPPALAAFVRDEATRAALAAALGLDWPSATISLGDVEDAIEHLAGDPSPRYLVVDLANVVEPLPALDRLAEVCAPGTFLIALGEINDVGFYRTLRAAGVADYLVKPVTGEALGAALDAARRRHAAASEADKPTAANGRTVIVVGARGGVGATMIGTTLAWLSAEADRRRTVLVDLDLHCGSAGLALDTQPSHGLCEALESPSRIDSLFVASAASSLNERLHLLTSEEPLDLATVVQPGALELLIHELKRSYERVFLDLPRTDVRLLRESFALASDIVVVTDFSLAGLRDTNRLLALAKSLAPTAKRLAVANRVGSAKKGELPRAELEKAIGATFAVVTPEDSAAVARAINTGKPLPVAAPGSRATRQLKLLAGLLGEPAQPERRGLLARLLGGSKAKTG
jgi:pilus assembly protein CpaE